MTTEELRREALRGHLRYLAASRGLAARFTATGEEGGLRAVLARERGGEEVFFAVSPRGAPYLSLSLVLVVDEEFFHANVEEILAVTSRYEVSASLARDESLKAGEVYLQLSLRLFTSPPPADAFGAAVENLLAAKDALAAAFS